MAEPFGDWIGRSIEQVDRASPEPVRRLAATLGHDGAHWRPDVLPPLGHWLFHLPDASRADLGRDGHPAKGGFLPPIAQSRRMWAGGRLRFIAPVPFGAALTRRTTIADIAAKQGASGAMTLVTLRHLIVADGTPAIEEEQDLVYLPITPPGAARPIDLPAADSERRWVADEALLFRFSALTFNAHRIHYDLPYAREIELYPALVVHGPLQAMLLMDHALRDGLSPARFAFRARAPLYAGQPFVTARAGAALAVRGENGVVTMTADVGETPAR